MHEPDQTYDCSDAKVLTKLYGDLRPYALKKSHYMLGDLGLAQDVVQDVFVRLWKAPLIFPSIGAAYQWIYRSCHNASIDRLRTMKRQNSFVSSELVLSQSAVLMPQDRVMNQQQIHKILHHFSDREAAVLMYTAVDGLAHREIAELMDVSVKTIQRTVGAIEEKLVSLRRLKHK